MSKNIKSLSDYRDEDDDSDEDDGHSHNAGQKPQTHYAGGSEKSGQLIQDPPKRPGADEIVKSMFDKARKSGAEVVPEETSKGKQRFTGQGFRLGDGEEPAQSSSENAAQDDDDNQDEEEEFKIKTVKKFLYFWRNGFSIDDGPLRKFTDVENQAFLEDINRGIAPRELHTDENGRPIRVDLHLVDNKAQEYQEPKRVVKPFAGSGFKLGTPTPHVIGAPSSSSTAATTTTTSSSSSSSSSSTSTSSAPVSLLAIDSTQPVTTIQIRLADGTRLVSKFNTSHTIGDIRNFVAASRPGKSNFALMTTFPNKELTDDSMSIASAGLLNAVIVQKQL